jgi:hypothetical protein
MITIVGIDYPIRSDFRNAIRIMLGYEDIELTMLEKQTILLNILYETEPVDKMIAISQGLKFLNGGVVGEEDADEPSVRVYSFSKDANLIYAAFQQTHNIDLTTAEMHWWKFLALFMDLGSDTLFCNLVGLRKRLKTGKASKEEREAARDMQSLLELPEPDTRTLEEKRLEEEFVRSIGGA